MYPNAGGWRNGCSTPACLSSARNGWWDGRVAQPASARRDEETAVLGVRAAASSDARRTRSAHRTVLGAKTLAGLAELRVADGQQLAFQVDVLAVKTDRFSDPQPGVRREQPDERLKRRRAQRRAQPALRRPWTPRQDLPIAIEVRGRAVYLLGGRRLRSRWSLAGGDPAPADSARSRGLRAAAAREIAGAAAGRQPAPISPRGRW